MIANIAAYLLIIGLLSLVNLRQRYEQVAAMIITALTFGVFYYFLQSWQVAQETVFTLLWDSSRSGDIKIDIISSAQNHLIIFPFFVITLIALFNNIFFRYEQKKRVFSAILVLNLLSLIMLIASNNFIQVITFVFVIDILSQLLIKDIHASRRYTVYNLIADMGLFLVLAMVHGKLENLDVGNIHRYYETGRHRDFVTIIILLSLFIKFGFFLFQSYLLDLKSTKFHRLILIPYLSTPIVALILFVKFYPLLVVSPSFLPILNIAVGLTILWGAMASIVINNLKEKAIYLNLMIIALLVKLVEEADFIWNMHFSWLLILGFLFNCCIYYLHYYASRENNVVFIAKFQKANPLPLKLVLLLLILLIAAFSAQLATVYNAENAAWILSFGFLFTFGVAHMANQILRGENGEMRIVEFDYRPLPFLMAIAIISLGIFYLEFQHWPFALIAIGMFSFWLALYPLEAFLKNDKLNQKLQNIDVFSKFYDTVIAQPIKTMGRFLTILVDFVFIEKTIISAITSLSLLIVRWFRKANRFGFWRYMGCLLLGIGIFVWCFIRVKS